VAYTDFKTPRKTQHDDLSWTVKLNISEGAYTREFGPRGVRLEENGYERTSLLRTVVLSYPPMTETALEVQLRTELATDSTRTPIPEQVNG
jgi:hypothetical protein